MSNSRYVYLKSKFRHVIGHSSLTLISSKILFLNSGKVPYSFLVRNLFDTLQINCSGFKNLRKKPLRGTYLKKTYYCSSTNFKVVLKSSNQEECLYFNTVSLRTSYCVMLWPENSIILTFKEVILSFGEKVNFRRMEIRFCF